MESAQEVSYVAEVINTIVVSILVVMESAQEATSTTRRTAEAKVSILVVMESAQEAEAMQPHVNAWLVSILVVMESAQEAISPWITAVVTFSFNPCCNGKCSGSRSPDRLTR